MKAEITFLAPTTRVNSNSLRVSELSSIDVYDNYGGDKDAPEGKVSRVGAAPGDDRNVNRSTRTVNDAYNDANDPNNVNNVEDTAAGRKAAKAEAKATKAANKGKGKTDDGRVHRIIGSISGKQIRDGVFETEELGVGAHYFSLVAVDTDGRSADPSAPFRLNVPKDSTHEPQRMKDAPDEPSMARNISGTGSDPDRPSLVTKVSVKLL